MTPEIAGIERSRVPLPRPWWRFWRRDYDYIERQFKDGQLVATYINGVLQDNDDA